MKMELRFGSHCKQCVRRKTFKRHFYTESEKERGDGGGGWGWGGV